jgi:hypothetical protein
MDRFPVCVCFGRPWREVGSSNAESCWRGVPHRRSGEVVVLLGDVQMSRCDGVQCVLAECRCVCVVMAHVSSVLTRLS